MKKIIKLKEKDLHKIVKRVISEENETNLQEKGMSKPTEGKIIRKRYNKRDGENIVKHFIFFETEPFIPIGSCGPPDSPDFDACVSRMDKNYILLCDTSTELLNQKIVFDLMIGVKNSTNELDPMVECTSLDEMNYVSLSEYTPPTPIEPEDDWWNNEIADDNENIDG